MDSFSSYLIIQARFLQHESKNFYRIYSAFEKLMFREESKIKYFWTTKQTTTGMRIKFYFNDIQHSHVLVESSIFQKLIRLVNDNFSFKLQIIFPESSGNANSISAM